MLLGAGVCATSCVYRWSFAARLVCDIHVGPYFAVSFAALQDKAVATRQCVQWAQVMTPMLTCIVMALPGIVGAAPGAELLPQAVPVDVVLAVCHLRTQHAITQSIPFFALSSCVSSLCTARRALVLDVVSV